MDPIVDVITASGGGFAASGGVAMKLLNSGFKASSLRTNDVLRKDEWKQYDTKVIEVARTRLIGVADLLAAGLRYDVSNALGTTRVEWETVSDMDAAEISMSGVTPGQNDRAVFTLKNVPLPIIHKDFNINIRALEASRRTGDSLDTTQAALCSRLVSEQIETVLFNGATLVHNGSSIYGYTTAPNRNTGVLTGDWSTFPVVTGENILADVISMIAAAEGDNMYGPYALYVPTTYYNVMLNDFKAASDKSILQRIEEIPQITSVKASSNLSTGANGEVLLIQMTSDVVDMVVGQQHTVVQWESQGGMVVNFKVMAIMVPRIKDDANTQSGITHYSV